MASTPSSEELLFRRASSSCSTGRSSQSTNRTSRKVSAWFGNVFQRRVLVISSQGHGEMSRTRRASRSDPAQRCRLVRTPKLRRRSPEKDGRFAAHCPGGSESSGWGLRSGSTISNLSAHQSEAPTTKGTRILRSCQRASVAVARRNAATPKRAESTQTASNQREVPALFTGTSRSTAPWLLLFSHPPNTLHDRSPKHCLLPIYA